MREMKDSGVEWIGAIPSDWPLIRFKDKYTNIKEIARERSVEFERLALTLNGVIKRPKDDSEGLQPKEFDGYQILRENDFVFKMIDLQNVSTSRVGLSPYTGLVSPAYIRFSPKKQDQYSRFVYYFLMSMYYNCVYNNLGGNGVRSALNGRDMGEFPIPYPDDAEQRMIGNLLDEKCSQVDILIANVQSQIEKLKSYKQSLITEVVTKGLDPTVPMKDSGVEWIGDIPEAWRITKLKHVGRFTSGYAFPSSDFLPNGVKVIKITNIQPMQMNFEEMSFVDEKYTKLSSFIVPKGALVFALTRPIIRGGIKAAIFESSETMLLNQRNAMFVGNDSITTKWQYYLMLNTKFVEQFELCIDKTGQQPNISTNDIQNICILLPSPDEQRKLSDYLDQKCTQIDQLIAIKQKKIDKLHEYKKSLIYECVTGKKEV